MSDNVQTLQIIELYVFTSIYCHRKLSLILVTFCQSSLSDVMFLHLIQPEMLKLDGDHVDI